MKIQTRLQNYFVPIAVPYSSYAFRKSWIYVLSWDGEREKKNFRLNVSCTRFLFYLGTIHILRKALLFYLTFHFEMYRIHIQIAF